MPALDTDDPEEAVGVNKETEAVREAGREFAMNLPPGGNAVITIHLASPSFGPSTMMIRLEESDLERASVLLKGWIPQVLVSPSRREGVPDRDLISMAESWQVGEDNGIEIVWKKPQRRNPAESELG